MLISIILQHFGETNQSFSYFLKFPLGVSFLQGDDALPFLLTLHLPHQMISTSVERNNCRQRSYGKVENCLKISLVDIRMALCTFLSKQATNAERERSFPRHRGSDEVKQQDHLR